MGDSGTPNVKDAVDSSTVTVADCADRCNAVLLNGGRRAAEQARRLPRVRSQYPRTALVRMLGEKIQRIGIQHSWQRSRHNGGK